MPREDEDYDDDRPRRKRGRNSKRDDDEFDDSDDLRGEKSGKGGVPVWIWILLGVGAVVLICCGGGFLVVSRVGTAAKNKMDRIEDGARRSNEERQADPLRKVYDFEEFRALVLGKTPQQIEATVGLPTLTGQSSEPPTKWTYYNRTRDPSTGKERLTTLVYFKDGRASSVE